MQASGFRHWIQGSLADVLEWPRATMTLAVAAKLSLTSLSQHTLQALVTVKMTAVTQKSQVSFTEHLLGNDRLVRVHKICGHA